MSARRDKWTMVRLPNELHAALVTRAKAFQELGRQGNMTVPYDPDADYPALHKVIAELLGRDLAHMQRSRQSRRTTGRVDRHQEEREASGQDGQGEG